MGVFGDVWDKFTDLGQQTVDASGVIAQRTGFGNTNTALTEEDRQRYLEAYQRMLSAEGQPAYTPEQIAANPLLATQVNDAQGQQIRGQQMGYLDALAAAADGRAPSVAEASYLRNLKVLQDRNAAGAAAATGNQRVAAEREAMLANAGMGQQAALDAAMLRAQEQTAARGQQGAALEGVRAQDTNLSTTNAQLNQRTNEVNEQNRLSAAGSNQGAGLQGAQLEQNRRAGLRGDQLGALAGASGQAGQILAAQQGDNERRAKLVTAGLEGGATAGATLATGKAKPMAEGGIVTKPTFALVGEAGPEAVIPLKGAGDHEADLLEAMARMLRARGRAA